MNNDFKKKYISIGEFSKLCNVPRKTLIFYDNIGVFSPDYRNTKGYRYYGINQYDNFTVLAELREIGMSLEEIKNYLKYRNPDKYIELLNVEKDKIVSKINKLNSMKELIENKIDIATMGIKASETLNPYIKFCEKEYIVSSYIKAKNSKELAEDITEFINYCIQNNLYKGYPICAIVSNESLVHKKYSNLYKFFMKLDEEIDLERVTCKPEGLYACINHVGSYETTYKSYEVLVDYIKQKNYKIVGDSYETGLLDFFAIKDEQEYITEIAIQVEPIK